MNLLRQIHQSLVFKMGAILLTLVTLAMSTLLASYFVVDQADRDAEAVNLSGSLRMLSYRLLAQRLALNHAEITVDGQSEARFTELVDAFENRLAQQLLFSEAIEHPESPLGRQYQQVQAQWSRDIRPLFDEIRQTAAHPTTVAVAEADLIRRVDAFVIEVDQLVSLYQTLAEGRIHNLRFIQLSAMLLTLGLVGVSLLILHRRVELPLRQLTEMATRVGRGDFSQPVSIDSRDELAVLGQTLNQTARDLDHLYQTLESQVRDKTRELKRSADSLSFLYDIARDVSEQNRDSIDFDHWLGRLSATTGLQDLDLCLKTPESVIPFVHLRSDPEAPLAPHCEASRCGDCMQASAHVAHEDGSRKLHYPIIKEGVQYGTLVCDLSPCGVPQLTSDWQHQLLQSFSDQVAVALSIQNQTDQDRRVALMAERSVIARELHDSLAQALSYLKIQVTRLRRVLKQPAPEADELDAITSELQEGISSAYRQLRELLTTFRLTISEKGLKAALTHTVEQLREQYADFSIELLCDIDRIPLTPNEEIHLLQLVREALQNAIRHSGGHHVIVRIREIGQNRVQVNVTDDGKGLPDDPTRMNHYGLAIMQERARNLLGELAFRRPSHGGTDVEFRFRPATLVAPDEPVEAATPATPGREAPERGGGGIDQGL